MTTPGGRFYEETTGPTNQQDSLYIGPIYDCHTKERRYNIDIMTHQTGERDFRRSGGSISNFIRRNIPIALFFIFASGAMLVVYYSFNDDAQSAGDESTKSPVESVQIDPNAPVAPINKPLDSEQLKPALIQSSVPKRVGIIAGHRGSDSGTECQDGLTEVEVTSDLAEKVASKLRRLDFDAETLDEFDPQLENYSAGALISIHVDSCDYINDAATGFKIAGSPFTDSSALTICVEHSFEAATSLPYHPHSVTPHMSEYHAFRKIGPGTPALIIEVGFLYLDRDILTIGSDSVVDGLVNGLLCYLQP